MQIVERFPREIQMHDAVMIPLSDGTVLAARIWRPVDSEAAPVPAILEYLPYRLRDGTIERDSLTHPYFAGHGYASIRVDMRGSGDSEGVLLGEYLKQEQDDALEVIAWIAAQPWCTGSVGMIGISWGGFNGLQVAARRPPALKAVVSLCSTDDRYADDIHFMGGSLLLEKFYWAATMFSINTAPPDPSVVGEKWRAMWLERLDRDGLWLIEWLRHQRRDAFYKHASVCEDWAAIQCPVYAVGGWADGYANAVFRLLSNLKVPRKGLVGPWAHKYPHFAKPGPQIGFLQECLRWWDHWLKGHDTGIMKEPMLRAWLEEPSPPRSHHDEKPGRWVAESIWPAREIAQQRWSLEQGRLSRDPAQAPGEVLAIRSPQSVGLGSASWFTMGLGHDQPTDQRIEAGGSLCFDTDVLQQDLELLGAPVAELEVSVDRPNALVACTLSEIMPDQSVARISYGILNLTHRDSHEHPTPLVPGKKYNIRVRMNELGHRFAAGNRVRLAISTAFWPIVWPSPEPVTLSIHSGGSGLELPVRSKRSADASLAPFQESAAAPPLRKTYLEEPHEKRTITTDVVAGTVEWFFSESEGTFRIEDINLTRTIEMQRRLLIHPADPTSARAEARAFRAYSRGDWRASAEVILVLTSDRDNFYVTARLDAYEAESKVFSRSWDERIPRDLV
jgi:uncharacterized protein